ncbi:hypothetical protein D3C76_1880160 [compost metagenome]
MCSARVSVTGDLLCSLRSSMMLHSGSCGRPSASPTMRMSAGIRLCSWAVSARPALTTAMIADRLGLV